jgi:hypothetical protein
MRLKPTKLSGYALLFTVIAAVVVLAGCEKKLPVTAEEARAIAEEAYVFAYPMLENYQTMAIQAIDETSGGFEAPFNRFVHKSLVFDANTTETAAPNNDIFYSSAWLDLRLEPVVLGVPAIPQTRYYHIQLVDAYTHNFAYIGTRTTGTDAGDYLITGPGWQGTAPDGISAVIRCESEFALALIRTQAGDEEGAAAASAVQQQYRLAPLSRFLDTPPPQPPTEDVPMEFPVWVQQQAESAGFIEYFNFFLAHLQPVPDYEKPLLERFAAIGIGPAAIYNPEQYGEGVIEAIDTGIRAAIEKIEAQIRQTGKLKNGWQLIYDVFGDREWLKEKYLTRAVGAHAGLYGASISEQFTTMTFVDAAAQPLDGANSYTLRFTGEEIPPVSGFWSLTLYQLPERRLVDNPINRYSIGGRTAALRFDRDGSLTIYIQNENPGRNREANWLPAPEGPFYLVLRLYWPEQQVVDGAWVPPAVNLAE